MLEEFKSEKTFRYAAQGDISTAHTLLYVLHGYGQLAEYFVRKFSSLGEGYFIVAPEGMHRFYLNGTSGRVGASWMTKEAREVDIADNLHWLNQLDGLIDDKSKKLRKVILGFSQGGATAARWYYQGNTQADQLIMWASVFPPDLNLEQEINDKQNTGTFVVGTKDPYFSDENTKAALVFFDQQGFTTVAFEGVHDIDEKTLHYVLEHE
jgi:predicted esterase